MKEQIEYLINSIILKKYPEINLFVGDKDPLYDDCIRFSYNIW